ncbi:hypothetical protein CK203_057773, partial [Vitis vinifera]
MVMGTLEIKLLIGRHHTVAEDVFIPAEPVLQISHSDDDLLLTRFTFDEVQVLDMMRGMSYLPGIGLGRRQHGPSEFMTIPIMMYLLDLGSSPLRLTIDIWHDCARSELSITQEADLQRLVRQLRLSDGAPGTSIATLTALASPDRMSLMTLYFPDEIDEHGTFAEHRLPLLPHARPVKQKLRRLHPRWSLQVKRRFRSSSVWDFYQWSSTRSGWPMSSLFPKRTAKSLDVVLYGRIFRVQSDLDGSRGHREDVLHYKWGTYCYRVMSFELKNAGATYQRAVATLFHDMMHQDVETVQMRLNPKKCTFWSDFWETLGYMVRERGI